jgi:hypothetical protein
LSVAFLQQEKGEGNVDWLSGRDRSGVCLRWLADCQRSVRRTASTPPTDGYALVVDEHFKTQFAKEEAAKKAAVELLAKYPMLQLETLVKQYLPALQQRQ